MKSISSILLFFENAVLHWNPEPTYTNRFANIFIAPVMTISSPAEFLRFFPAHKNCFGWYVRPLRCHLRRFVASVMPAWECATTTTPRSVEGPSPGRGMPEARTNYDEPLRQLRSGCWGRSSGWISSSDSSSLRTRCGFFCGWYEREKYVEYLNGL